MVISSQQQKLIRILKNKISERIEAGFDFMSASAKRSSSTILKELEVIVEGLGSIANTVGLKGFYRSTVVLRNNFQLLSLQKTTFSPDVVALINSWPIPLSGYLHSLGRGPEEEDAVEVILDFLSDTAWAAPLALSSYEDVKQEFLEPFLVDTHGRTKSPVIISKAMASLVIPLDVEETIVDDFLTDLAFQAEAFDCAVEQFLITEDELQLRVAQRIAHNVKGSANAIGVRGLAYLMHYVEDALSLSAKTANVDSRLGFVLQDSADCLAEIADYLNGLGPQPEAVAHAVQSVLDYVNSQSNTTVKPEASTIKGLKKIQDTKDFHLESLIAFNDPGLKVNPPGFHSELLKFEAKSGKPPSEMSGQQVEGEHSNEGNKDKITSENRPLFTHLDDVETADLSYEVADEGYPVESFDALMFDLKNADLGVKAQEVNPASVNPADIKPTELKSTGARPLERKEWDRPFTTESPDNNIELPEIQVLGVETDQAELGFILTEAKMSELEQLSLKVQQRNTDILSFVEDLILETQSQIEGLNSSAMDDSINPIPEDGLLALRKMIIVQSELSAAIQQVLTEVGDTKADSKEGVDDESAMPMELRSCQTLIVSVGASQVCILSDSIERIIYVEEERLIERQGVLTYQLANEKDPISVFKLKEMIFPDAPNVTRFCSAMVVIADEDEHRTGVLIESIIKSEKLLVKPQAHLDPKVLGAVGTTVLNDDTVTPVVDLHELLIGVNS